MALPILTGTGRLCSDGELRYTAAGMPVYAVNLAFSARKKDDNGDWVDGDKLFIRATAFRDQAESLAESLGQGDEVVVSGRVKLDQWEDKQTGEKRSRAALLVDSIGPNVRRNRVTVRKPDRSGGQPSADPWGSAADEPPF